jgi:protein phosphatase
MATLYKSDRQSLESQSYQTNPRVIQVIESICAGGACDPGLIRESNEDRCFYRAFNYTGELGEEQGLIAAVADGMGGHAAGETASERAVQVLAAKFSRIHPGDQSRQVSPDWPTLLREAIQQANKEVYEEAKRWSSLAGMGTTLTAVVIASDVMYIGHVGDSRAYIIRNDKIIALTNDHTWVAQRVRENRMTMEEAKMSDRRGQLTNAIGLKDTVQPDIDAIGLKPGDRIVLCTDGITEMVDDTDILAWSGSSNNPQKSANNLIAAANKAGGLDNSGVVIIRCQGETQRRKIGIPLLKQKPPVWAIAALVLIIILLAVDGIYLASRYMSKNNTPAEQLHPHNLRGIDSVSQPAFQQPDSDSSILDLSGKPVEVSPKR